MRSNFTCWPSVSYSIVLAVGVCDAVVGGVVMADFHDDVTVRLSESDRILAAAIQLDAMEITQHEFNQIVLEQQETNPALRLRNRNQPAFAITFGDGVLGELTSLELSINEQAFLFGTGDTSGDGFLGFARLSQFSDDGVSISNSSVDATQRTLTVDFSGMTDGESVIFRVDLDGPPAVPSAFPGYREVLLGVDAGSGSPRSGSYRLTLANDGTVTTDEIFFANGLTAWEHYYGSVGREQGDFDDDGDVDGNDFLLWQRMGGEPGFGTAPVSVVPEPNVGSLLLATFLLIGFSRTNAFRLASAALQAQGRV